MLAGHCFDMKDYCRYIIVRGTGVVDASHDVAILVLTTRSPRRPISSFLGGRQGQQKQLAHRTWRRRHMTTQFTSRRRFPPNFQIPAAALRLPSIFTLPTSRPFRLFQSAQLAVSVGAAAMLGAARNGGDHYRREMAMCCRVVEMMMMPAQF